MKKLLLTCLLLFVSSTTFADVQCINIDSLEKKDKTFYHNGKIYTGCAQSLYKNGKIETKGNIKNGKLVGELPTYTEDGIIKANLIFKNGEPSILKDYDSNGKLKSEFTFPSKETMGYSYFKSFYPNGKLKETGRNNPNDKPDGIIKAYYENGKLAAETTYKNGIVEGPYKTYYPNGKLHVTGTYKNNQPDGEITLYYDNGVLKSKKTLKNGKLVYKTRKVIVNNKPETAIIVSSVPDEYEYLNQEYPGFKLQQQALLRTNPVMDLMEIKTADGKIKTFYFDISSFFGTESESEGLSQAIKELKKSKQTQKQPKPKKRNDMGTHPIF